MIAVLGAGSVFCALMAIYSILQMRSSKQQTHEVIEKWMQPDQEVRWSDNLADRLDQTAWAKRLEPQLKRASIKIRPAEYGAILFAIGFGLTLILYLGLDAPLWMGLLVGTSVTPLLSKLFLLSRRKVYVNRIDAQLSEACRLLSSAARAGLSIPQGLELVVKEMPSPIRDELGVTVRELQLGRDLEVSLRELLTRVSSRDLQVFVNALIIQRRAGGNLANVLSEMANTMEERKIIHQTIEASIAQARYTAYLLPAVSLLILFMMSKLIDEFFGMFTTFFGMVILAIFLGMQLIAFLLIKKISDIKI